MQDVAIIGLGTIGSALAPLVARMPNVASVALVDSDTYTESNLANQAIDTSALGRPKAAVQASLLRAINPNLDIVALEQRIENVPLGWLRNSILVACVDNRKARQTINRIAWRCNRPWIDAAVGAPSLVKVGVYVPDAGGACLECGWDDRSYDLLEQEYPCKGADTAVPASGAPLELGTLAAALQAAELRKLIDADPAKAVVNLIGAQLMLDTTTYSQSQGSFAVAEGCRFDHEVWRFEAVSLQPDASTLADLFDATDAVSVGIEGDCFTTYLDCVQCGKRASIDLALYGRLSPGARTCSCGGRMFAPGFFSFESVERRELSSTKSHAKLASVGFRDGDVVSPVDNEGRTRRVEIGSEAGHD